jgi:hypothetical protein
VGVLFGRVCREDGILQRHTGPKAPPNTTVNIDRFSMRIARRFLSFEGMILRFATRPDLGIFTNNQAERPIRPAKVQQRSSGGCWRTLSTAAKWGISTLDALRDLFNGHAWMPPGLEPAG